MGWPNRRALEAGIASQEFPAPRKRFPVRASKFPVPGRREFFANPAVGLENLGPSSARGARFPRNSLHFPCISGNWPRRRVRYRLRPPPFSQRDAETSRAHRGLAREIPAIPRALAVPLWRVRTGDCGLRAWKAPQSVLVSVAELGGSVSLSVRLSEGRRSTDFPAPPTDLDGARPRGAERACI